MFAPEKITKGYEYMVKKTSEEIQLRHIVCVVNSAKGLEIKTGPRSRVEVRAGHEASTHTGAKITIILKHQKNMKEKIKTWIFKFIIPFMISRLKPVSRNLLLQR